MNDDFIFCGRCFRGDRCVENGCAQGAFSSISVQVYLFVGGLGQFSELLGPIPLISKNSDLKWVKLSAADSCYSFDQVRVSVLYSLSVLLYAIALSAGNEDRDANDIDASFYTSSASVMGLDLLTGHASVACQGS